MKLINKIFDIIYPPVCGICGNIDANFLCESCKKKLDKIRCDKIDIYDEKKNFYHQHFYVFQYQEVIREKILSYKFNDCAYLYKTFEKILLNDKKVCEFIKAYDIIIPVPIHKNRKKERGYNQSSLVITGLLKDLKRKGHHIYCDDKILLKVKDTHKQSLLTREERKRNIKNAYCINKNAINFAINKSILIFDDIYTTGSTVYECAKTIKELNPKKIDILTLAKD